MSPAPTTPVLTLPIVAWPLPAAWLALNLPLTPAAIKEKAPNAPTELLIWALHTDRKLVEEMAIFIGADIVVPTPPPVPSVPLPGSGPPSGATPAISGPLTRSEWFADLADELKTKAVTHEEYLDSRWNPLFLEYGSPPKTFFVLNPLGIPVRYWSNHPVWYDPELITFYSYETSSGVWRARHEQDIMRSVIEFLIPLAPGKPIFLPTNETVSGIVKQLKSLGLKELTGIEERPLHLGNTMLFMKGRKIAPFSPAYYSRNRVAVEYVPGKYGCTSFRKLLSDSLDVDDIKLLQTWCGMVLLNKNPYHKIMLLSGAAGSGKSTFINILQKILGSENVATLVVDRLEDRFELGEFFGKSLLVARDVSSDFLKSKKVHMLKSLSGDKHIKAEIKFANKRITLEGPFNIGMLSNSELNISLQGDMDAWKRRLLVIKFDPLARAALTGRPMFTTNPTLEEQILSTESTGVLHWMLQGADRVLAALRAKKDFPMTPTQIARVQSLLKASDEIVSFVANAVKPTPGRNMTTSDLYDEYVKFCSPLGVFPEPSTVFARRICKPMLLMHKSESITVSSPGAPRGRGYSNVSV